MDRDELLAEMAQVSREGASRALMLHQAVADRFGLGPSDIKCLDLARDEPDLTAGRLAEATGLSASAVTSVLDRLERAGFIERVRGTEDRREGPRPLHRTPRGGLGVLFAEGGGRVCNDHRPLLGRRTSGLHRHPGRVQPDRPRPDPLHRRPADINSYLLRGPFLCARSIRAGRTNRPTFSAASARSPGTPVVGIPTTPYLAGRRPAACWPSHKAGSSRFFLGENIVEAFRTEGNARQVLVDLFLADVELGHPGLGGGLRNLLEVGIGRPALGDVDRDIGGSEHAKRDAGGESLVTRGPDRVGQVIDLMPDRVTEHRPGRLLNLRVDPTLFLPAVVPSRYAAYGRRECACRPFAEADEPISQEDSRAHAAGNLDRLVARRVRSAAGYSGGRPNVPNRPGSWKRRSARSLSW